MHESHTIPSRSDVVFRTDYAVDQAELRRLYENAKRDQWNATNDIPWSLSVDAGEGLLADELVDAFGTTHWRRLSTSQQAELNRRLAAWRLRRSRQSDTGSPPSTAG